MAAALPLGGDTALHRLSTIGHLLQPHKGSTPADPESDSRTEAEQRFGRILDDYGFPGRVSENLSALMMFADHPIVGVGSGGFRLRYAEYADRIGIDQRPMREAHNLYLEVAAETGVVGIAAFIFLFASLFVGLITTYRRLVAAGEVDLGRSVAGLGMALVAYLLAASTPAPRLSRHLLAADGDHIRSRQPVANCGQQRVSASLFWVSTGLILYVWAGYPLLVALLARLRAPAPPPEAMDLPAVTLIVSAYEEEAAIESKLANCLDLDYPADRLQILVATEPSGDRTVEIVLSWAARGIETSVGKERRGKAAALNSAIEQARGEVVAFTDAEQSVGERGAEASRGAASRSRGGWCGRLKKDLGRRRADRERVRSVLEV